MASFGSEIKLNGGVQVAKPYFALTGGFGFSSFRTITTLFYVAASYRAYQSAHKKSYVAHGGGFGFSSFTTTENIYMACSYRAYQASFFKPYVAVTGWGATGIKPDAKWEKLFRLLTEAKSTSKTLTSELKLSGRGTYSFAVQDPTEVYFNFVQPTDVVDILKTIVWWGGSSPNDFALIEYRERPTAQNPNPVWEDIFKSQSWIVANGAPNVTPTMTWTQAIDPDETQTLTYELVIAFDYELENVAFLKTGLTELSYTLSATEALDSDQTYFWAIRAKDNIGDTGDWSRVQSFTIYKFNPPEVKVIDSDPRILISFRKYKYDWQVGNLAEGEYQFAIKRATIENDIIVAQEDVIDRNDNRFFIVDHAGENPPEILSINYEPSTYKLFMDIKISDSKFRDYDIKNIEFADQKDKVVGDDLSGYNIDSYDWRLIPQIELIGRKKQLTSNPFISKSAILGWFFGQTRLPGQTYFFEIKVTSGLEEETKDFYWARRPYDNNNNPLDWEETYFDHTDNSVFQKPVAAFFQTEPKPTAGYHGKANPFGIAMNITYFQWVPEIYRKWDFAIFPSDTVFKDGIDPSQDPLHLQTGMVQPFARVKPKIFFDAAITNVILDLKNIEQESYELHTQEVDKIVEAIPNKDFFWKVRAFDQRDHSNWSRVTQSTPFNIHHIEWDIRNNNSFTSSNFIVLKVNIKPSIEPAFFEYPYFHWLNITNPELTHLEQQIRAFEDRRDNSSENLKSFYESYITFLKKRMLDVRNYVLGTMINEGFFQDADDFHGFIDANLHDKPVYFNDGTRTSELDIHDETLRDINQLHQPLINDIYPWSPVYYNWRMDLTGKEFQSQEGKPLRNYDQVGMSCENKTYKGCFLITGDQNTCPWFGRADLGFCNGFVTGTETLTQNQIPLDLFNSGLPIDIFGEIPDPAVDPDAFVQWAKDNDLAGLLQTALENAQEEVEIGQVFEKGACPMAATLVDGTNGWIANVSAGRTAGDPCVKYNRVDGLLHQKTCEVCGTPRKPRYIGHETDKAADLSEDIFSDLHPAGFAVVEIKQDQLQVSPRGPIADRDQSRNPQLRFTGIKLRKAQLPGELHGDFVDSEDESVVINPFFRKTLGTPTALTTNSQGTWYPVIKAPSAASQIIEII